MNSAELNGLRICLLSGGKDQDYALGLARALGEAGPTVELVGNGEMAGSPLAGSKHVEVLDFLGVDSPRANPLSKVARLATYYLRLVLWAARSRSKLFHILWYRKFPLLERHLLNTYFRMLGKRLVYTSHNVDDRARDGEFSTLNHWSLRRMYRGLDHILVHTEKMKRELIEISQVDGNQITVVPHGINDRMPETDLTRQRARHRLGYQTRDRVLLFFGNIAPYKGVDLLIGAMEALLQQDSSYRLIVAGRVKRGSYLQYWQRMCQRIEESSLLGDQIRLETRFIQDEEVEVFFKGSDVCVLPYRRIDQSGVMILSYRFGLPVIATDVGSLREDILDGQTGLVSAAADPADLARTIESYFASDLFRELENRRAGIQQFAVERFSWKKNVERTLQVYRRLL